MGSEMTLTAEEPALQVMMDGSPKMSVITTSQETKPKVKNYWEKNKPQNEIILICWFLNMWSTCNFTLICTSDPSSYRWDGRIKKSSVKDDQKRGISFVVGSTK